MIFQAYRSKTSHFSTTTSVGMPWISFPTGWHFFGGRKQVFFFLEVSKLWKETVCKHMRKPDLETCGFSTDFGKSRVTEAKTMASVRTSADPSEKVWTQNRCFTKGCVFQGNAESSWDKGKGAQWIAQQICFVTRVRDGKQKRHPQISWFKESGKRDGM